MSKSIRKILGDAYSFVGLSPNGVLQASQVADGLQFANEILQKYNESCLFPFTFATLVGKVSGGEATISQDSETLKGDAPAAISKVYYKRSDTDYARLEKCEYADIFAVRNSGSTPMWYSFDSNGDDEGVLHFDALGTYDIMVIYPKKLPELGINDEFSAPALYEQVLRYGVAVRAAQKAGLEDAAIAPAQKNLDDAVRIIMESNGAKRPVKHVLQTGLTHHDRFNNPRIF